jgi:hypothetical protein
MIWSCKPAGRPCGKQCLVYGTLLGVALPFAACSVLTGLLGVLQSVPCKYQKEAGPSSSTFKLADWLPTKGSQLLRAGAHLPVLTHFGVSGCRRLSMQCTDAHRAGWCQRPPSHTRGSSRRRVWNSTCGCKRPSSFQASQTVATCGMRSSLAFC